MFTKLAVFSAAVLATVANADLMATYFHSKKCTGPAFNQTALPTNVCTKLHEGNVSQLITCHGAAGVWRLNSGEHCSGHTLYSLVHEVGSCQTVGDNESWRVDSCT